MMAHSRLRECTQWSQSCLVPFDMSQSAERDREDLQIHGLFLHCGTCRRLNYIYMYIFFLFLKYAVKGTSWSESVVSMNLDCIGVSGGVYYRQYTVIYPTPRQSFRVQIIWNIFMK